MQIYIFVSNPIKGTMSLGEKSPMARRASQIIDYDANSDSEDASPRRRKKKLAAVESEDQPAFNGSGRAVRNVTKKYKDAKQAVEKYRRDTSFPAPRGYNSCPLYTYHGESLPRFQMLQSKCKSKDYYMGNGTSRIGYRPPKNLDADGNTLPPLDFIKKNKLKMPKWSKEEFVHDIYKRQDEHANHIEEVLTRAAERKKFNVQVKQDHELRALLAIVGGPTVVPSPQLVSQIYWMIRLSQVWGIVEMARRFHDQKARMSAASLLQWGWRAHQSMVVAKRRKESRKMLRRWLVLARAIGKFMGPHRAKQRHARLIQSIIKRCGLKDEITLKARKFSIDVRKIQHAIHHGLTMFHVRYDHILHNMRRVENKMRKEDNEPLVATDVIKRFIWPKVQLYRLQLVRDWKNYNEAKQLNANLKRGSTSKIIILIVFGPFASHFKKFQIEIDYLTTFGICFVSKTL